MKLFFSILFFLPAVSFACPNFSGAYKCTNRNPNERIDRITFQPKRDQIKVTEDRFGWHIVGGDDRPFSGHPETGPYSESYDLVLGTTTRKDGNYIITKTVTCDNKTITLVVNIHELQHPPSSDESSQIRFTRDDKGNLLFDDPGFSSAPLYCT